MINSREELLTIIKEDGAEDWQAVVEALQDFEYLLSVGDMNINTIEDASNFAQTMQQSHPDYKF